MEMASRKRKHENRNRRKRKRTSAPIKSLKAAIRAAQAAVRNGAPRPRVKLPEAFRAIGLDEYAIAQCFAEQIEQIRNPEKKQRIARKLLLDWLKECVRILYAAARRGDVPEQPATIELVHFVPRPDRSSDAMPQAESPLSQPPAGAVPSGAVSSVSSPVFDRPLSAFE